MTNAKELAEDLIVEFMHKNSILDNSVDLSLNLQQAIRVSIIHIDNIISIEKKDIFIEVKKYLESKFFEFKQTQAESILRKNLKVICEVEDGGNFIISYKDALKAVEEALNIKK